MRDMVISVSGFTPKIKENMQRKVEYMGGIYMKQLRSCVTHLITDSVMSAKYEKASEKKIQIFSGSWLDAVWEENQTGFIKASDPIFNTHRCPVFMNLVVTSTGLSKRRKDEVKRLINENGGEFSGQLDGARVKIVLAKEYSTISEKINYAMQTNIACLRCEWVDESLKENYALPFSKFIISPSENKQKSSTPERNSTQASLNFSTISCIGRDAPPVNLIEETLTSTMSSVSPATPAGFSVPVAQKSGTQTSGAIFNIDKIDMNQVKKAGPFLDGCNVYLAGFSTISKDKINKILNMGSATRLDDISDALTHVIVEDSNRAIPDLKIIKSKGLNPHVLNLGWLKASLEQKKPASEDNYSFEFLNNDVNKVAPPSPLSKKNLEMLATQKRGRQPLPVPPSFNDTNKIVPMEKSIMPDDDENSLMKQYLQQTVTERSLNSFLPSKNISSPQPNNNIHNTSKNHNLTSSSKRDAQNESEIPLSQTCTISERIFEGLIFLVSGFNAEENESVIANISELGGKIVTPTFAGVPDYGVVPVTGTILKHTVNEIVTNLWVDDCIENEEILSIEYYHKPMSINEDTKPLKDCVIAISSYTGIERVYLSKLAVSLGAMHQETFARRTNIEKGLHAGTHLICTSPEGNKYIAAVKWSLPAVSKDWLIACAERLQLADETLHLIGETVAPERQNQENQSSNNMAPPVTPQSTNRMIITPKQRSQSNTMQPAITLETPIINKRLSLVQNGTPQSPFHVSTPQTPYGQVFKDNPSPETRKAYAKWIDGLPEKCEEPPRKKIRKTETPLSEIKRQLWSAMKKPIGESNKNVDTSIQNDEQFDNESDHLENLQQQGQELSPPTNRQLSFNEDTPKENDIQQQLEEMNKLLRANSNSSTESRFSIHGENGKPYETRHREDNCNILVTQPESVGWEDPFPTVLKSQSSHDNTTVADNTVNNLTSIKKKWKFMVSGIKDRPEYEKVLGDLGGQISADINYDSTATHLLCVRPSRNEKILASIAAGKWILHCSYLRDCEAAGKFLDENSYEWGNPKMLDVEPKLVNESEQTLAMAAHRWRVKRQNGSGGAFDGMVAMLLVNKDKYEQFERLINAGGGLVVQAKPPYTSSKGKKVTHCFVSNKGNQPIDWAMLASKGILCFQPHFLNLQLTTIEPINPRDHVLPEFKKYLALVPK